MADLRMKATGIESYWIDYDATPKAKDIYELQQILVPFYIKDMKTENAWDHPFHYEYSKDHYTICSYGKDGVRRNENGLYPPMEKPEDANRDIC